jgi:hypothetical protein
LLIARGSFQRSVRRLACPCPKVTLKCSDRIFEDASQQLGVPRKEPE